MPVQETLDAAAELGELGFRLGVLIVNRARPALVTAGLIGEDGAVDDAELRAGLQVAGVSAIHAPALAREMADYAQRQRLQEENAARLDSLDLPRVELPDLNPPIELGELRDLAACFRQGAGS